MFDSDPHIPDGAHDGPLPTAPPPAAVRHAFHCVAAFFGAILVMNGAFRLSPFPTPGRAVLAALTILIGLALLVPVLGVALYQVRRIYRYRADRCIHCGYSTRGISGVACPECGLDPFL